MKYFQLDPWVTRTDASANWPESSTKERNNRKEENNLLMGAFLFTVGFSENVLIADISLHRCNSVGRKATRIVMGFTTSSRPANFRTSIRESEFAMTQQARE